MQWYHLKVADIPPLAVCVSAEYCLSASRRRVATDLFYRENGLADKPYADSAFYRDIPSCPSKRSARFRTI